MSFSIKKFRLLALLPLLAAGACSDDPESPMAVDTTTGVYVINNGVQGMHVPGSVTAIDIEKGSATQQAFLARNGVQVGDTPQSAFIYGTKMYIAVFDSNIIWVVDATTLEIKSSIVPPAGTGKPREFTAAAGKVYASLYSGHVACIDTVSMTVEKTLAVGPNPEQMALTADGTLYVANSDGDNWMNGNINSSVSVVDVAAWKEVEKLQVGLNPTKMATNGTDVFVITMGNYNDIPATVKKITGSVTRDIAPGTLMAIRDKDLFVINSPVTGGDVTYTVYDMEGKVRRSEMVTKPVEYPAAIAVDSNSGMIFITSYKLGASGYAEYAEPCYGQLYTEGGMYMGRYELGLNAVNAVFRTSTTLMPR